MTQNMKHLIKSISNIHKPNGSPNVFLFSTPRSGSTWLMELIWTQPSFKYCPEPENLRRPLVRRHLGITEWSDLHSDRATPILRNYIQAFCDGRLGFLNPNPLSRYYRPFTHRIVFKILHAGEDRINWFRDTFNGRIVYLLRHPIAVSVSREVYPRLQAFLDSDYRQHFTREQLTYAQNVIDRGTKLERGVLDWCLQNVVPLRDATDDWAIVSYEQLVLQPQQVIEHLSHKLDLPKPERMMRRLSTPSGVKAKSNQETRQLLEQGDSNKWPLLVRKWRKDVDDAQERKAMEILKPFGLDVYQYGDILPTIWV
jgi:hypothetical protein